jgi:hypothetical protein
MIKLRLFKGFEWVAGLSTCIHMIHFLVFAFQVILSLSITLSGEIRIPVCVGEKVVNKLPIHEVSGFAAFHELK